MSDSESASMSKACMCSGTILPVSDEHSGAGHMVSQIGSVERLACYRTGSCTDRVVVLVTDIFGLKNERALQVADQIATGIGGTVLVPDFWLGEPWEISNFPPPDFSVLFSWVMDKGRWTGHVDGLFSEVLAYIAKEFPASVRIGTIGACWGALISTMGALEHPNSIRAVGGFHPSLVTTEIVEKLTCPMCYLHSKDEAPVDTFFAPVLERCNGNGSVLRRYEDMPHGWVFRGPFDEARVKAASEAVQICIDFFGKQL